MIHTGDAIEVLAGLPERSFQVCCTSPPYFGLRDYSVEGQGGLQSTPDEYVAWLVEVFRGVHRVLRDDGVCFVNMGDSYNADGRKGRAHMGTGKNAGYSAWCNKTGCGTKPKDMLGIPWMVAFALRADGWWLRDAIVWHKPAPMPGSQQDRCTSSYEFIFQLTKRATYFWDMEAVKEPCLPDSAVRAAAGFVSNPVREEHNNYRTGYQRGPGYELTSRTPRNVWKIAHDGFAGQHFATFPIELPTRCIKAATSERGCCPACGSPWERTVFRERVATRPGVNNVSDETGRANRDEQRHVTETYTVGWSAPCKCSACKVELHTPKPPVPCRVLDPFMGAGTTAIAANRLGRDWTGIELNPEYVTMANDRIGRDANPATHRSDDAGHAPLFEETT